MSSSSASALGRRRASTETESAADDCHVVGALVWALQTKTVVFETRKRAHESCRNLADLADSLSTTSLASDTTLDSANTSLCRDSDDSDGDDSAAAGGTSSRLKRQCRRILDEIFTEVEFDVGMGFDIEHGGAAVSDDEESIAGSPVVSTSTTPSVVRERAAPFVSWASIAL